MDDSAAAFGAHDRRVGTLTSARCGELDIMGAFHRHLLLVIAVVPLLVLLLAACLYYCNAYYKVQVELLEANIWRRVARAMEKEEDWKMKAWWDEENDGGRRREDRGRGRDAESKPRMYVRDHRGQGSRRPAENLRNISQHPAGNLRASGVSRPEMIEMREFTTERMKSKTAATKSHPIVEKQSSLSKTQQAKAPLGNASTPEEKDNFPKRPRMPLPGEIDSLYARPKSDLTSSDFQERFVYDAVEVPEYLARYRAAGGGQVNVLKSGEKQEYYQSLVHGEISEGGKILKEEKIADGMIPNTSLDAIPVYSQVLPKSKSKIVAVNLP